jgi:hypothetical protein
MEEGHLVPGHSEPFGDASAPPEGVVLPTPPGGVRRVMRQHPWLSDALPALAYGLLAVGLAVVSAAPPLRTPLWFTLLLLVAGLATVLHRRRRPVLMLAVAAALAALSLAGGTGAETVLPLRSQRRSRPPAVPRGCSPGACGTACRSGSPLSRRCRRTRSRIG